MKKENIAQHIRIADQQAHEHELMWPFTIG
jgi:hypothetical protein